MWRIDKFYFYVFLKEGGVLFTIEQLRENEVVKRLIFWEKGDKILILSIKMQLLHFGYDVSFILKVLVHIEIGYHILFYQDAPFSLVTYKVKSICSSGSCLSFFNKSLRVSINIFLNHVLVMHICDKLERCMWLLPLYTALISICSS